MSETHPDTPLGGITAASLIDLTRPSVARVYDHWLGGKDNYWADRELARKIARLDPEIPVMAKANRHALRRVVSAMAGQGIRQFLDLGAGLPTADNVHQIACEVNPGSRTVYVDNDPLVLAHARALLATDERTHAVAGDITRPSQIITEAGRYLNFGEPIGLTLFAILHFVPGPNVYTVVDELVAALAPGSCVAITHPDRTTRLEETAREYTAAPVYLRDKASVTPFFDGLALVPPGIVPLNHWRPEIILTEETPLSTWCAVGVKP